ncbi:DUF4760 domain-containing protein [Acetobacter sp. TBRC 12305]|uniref:DUF4760 domain-containing protein n=1 Tax=Acetobacter garciniae TaxID=2817435 RepID=A0A939HHN6_9PROT|nr:DUF4760 domain-containing protein [Acetobacter garciniae]MBO1323582.1 DUF4760 domain-containing protein [Acetobacter garciniae]MBX0343271.1 DUF4760 domain-containing protein [Acetobacter garciniae]
MSNSSSGDLRCELHSIGAHISDSDTLQLVCHGFHAGYSLLSYLPFIGAAAAALVAWWNVNRTFKANRVIAKKKATMDLILLEQTNDYILQKRTEFLKLKKEGDLVKWADPQRSGDTEASSIATVINKYEMIAIGIKNDSICADIYYDWLGSTLISDWEELCTFIGELRRMSKNYNLYINFEKLALEWRNKKKF